MDESPHYLGIDGCKGGWVGIIISDSGYFDAVKATTIAQIIADAKELARICVIGIDIPIGLPTSKLRPADIHARKALKPRGSTIFTTPTAEALKLSNPEASQVNRQALGQGVSAQALSLGPRIAEIAELLDDPSLPADCPIIEVHQNSVSRT
jgi:predicted RNase H-like nuclease